MKATLILSTLILLAAWTGCSDNMTGTDPLSQHDIASMQPNHTGGGDPELLFKQEELSVKVSNDFMAQNKVTYANAPFFGIASYVITFESKTNADRWSYGPVVEVSKDEEVVFQETDPNVINNGDIKEIRLDNVRFDAVKFYIALMQIDGSGPGTDDDGTDIYTLTLSHLKIVRVD